MNKTRNERARDARYIKNGILGALAFCLGAPVLTGLMEWVAGAL